MTPEDRVVCLCTRQAFAPSHQQQLLKLCQEQSINWDTVFETAVHHQVAPLVHHNLSQMPNGQINIPPSVQQQFQQNHKHNVLVKEHSATMLHNVLALLAAKKLDVMLVKGAALSRIVYNQPWYTTSYDIDMVLRARREEIDPHDYQEIVRVFEQNNRQRENFTEHIEYDFYEHHDVTMNNVLAVDAEQLWRDARQITLHDQPVYVMNPEDMLLAAAINSCRKRFFRLKSQCDIATIIDHYGTQLDWQLVADKAHAYKCNTIVYTALVATQVTLGCQLPAGFLRKLMKNPLRALLIPSLVKLLCRRLPLSQLFVDSGTAAHERQFSWPLFLTYATYRLDLLLPKLGEIISARRPLLPPTRP